MTFSWGAISWSFPCVCCLPLQIVMAPHEQAEEFIASYTKLMHGDTDTTNFQKVLEMKVKHLPSLPLLHSHTHTCTHSHMHTLTYAHTHAHTHTCTHSHMHTLTHAHTHMHTLTHAYTHMHTLTHAHTHTCTCVGSEAQ